MASLLPRSFPRSDASSSLISPPIQISGPHSFVQSELFLQERGARRGRRGSPGRLPGADRFLGRNDCFASEGIKCATLPRAGTARPAATVRVWTPFRKGMSSCLGSSPPLARLLLLLLTLAPALSWAGPRRPEPREEAVKGRFLPTLWSFVKALWEEDGELAGPERPAAAERGGQPRPERQHGGQRAPISTRAARRRFPSGRQGFGSGLTNCLVKGGGLDAAPALREDCRSMSDSASPTSTAPPTPKPCAERSTTPCASSSSRSTPSRFLFHAWGRWFAVWEDHSEETPPPPPPPVGGGAHPVRSLPAGRDHAP